MEKCIMKIIKIIASIALVNPLAAGRAYGGYSKDRHQDFHHSFEHHVPQGWHPVQVTWDSPEGRRHPPVHSYHQRQFPRGSHQDKEYWHQYAHNPVNWIQHSDWDNTDETRHSDWDNTDDTRHSDWGNSDGGRHSNWGNWGNTGNIGQSSWGNSGNAEDRYPQWSQWFPASQLTTTTTASPNAQSQQQIQACIRTCPTTPEYNPVCGSNNITYSNPGRLECARFCGIDVVLQRRTTCSAQTTLPPVKPHRTSTTPTTITTTTLPPITPPRITTVLPEVPSRFPNIDTSMFDDATTQSPSSSTTESFTIPPNVLSSIFTTSTSEPDLDIEIDIRTRNGDMDK